MFLVVAANRRVVKGPDTSSVVRIVGIHFNDLLRLGARTPFQTTPLQEGCELNVGLKRSYTGPALTNVTRCPPQSHLQCIPLPMQLHFVLSSLNLLLSVIDYNMQSGMPYLQAGWNCIIMACLANVE